MIVAVEGTEGVDVGEHGTLKGREVASIGVLSGAQIKPSEGEIWLVVNDFHGDHDTDWVVVIKGGRETMRMRLESPAVTEVIWKAGIE